MNIAILPGDGVGPEIINEALKILNFFKKEGLDITIEEADIGGIAYENHKSPLPSYTLDLAKSSDAVLLGAVGSPKYDNLPRELRPEKGLLMIRKELDLFANLRPVKLYNSLVNSSSLKPEIITDLDILILRELTSDIYFGVPKGQRVDKNGICESFDTMLYKEDEILRIAKLAFDISLNRKKKICSVDKANVLETSVLWRKTVGEVSKDYNKVSLQHMYVDNAAMQLVKNPKQFDVILTGNMFGDILSDQASMLTGSIGMLPSASVNSNNMGLYEPIHGSAPDIAGKNVVNPIATILSVAMMMEYGFKEHSIAKRIKRAVNKVLENGFRTKDIASKGELKILSTQEMGNEIVKNL